MKNEVKVPHQCWRAKQLIYVSDGEPCAECGWTVGPTYRIRLSGNAEDSPEMFVEGETPAAAIRKWATAIYTGKTPAGQKVACDPGIGEDYTSLLVKRVNSEEPPDVYILRRKLVPVWEIDEVLPAEGVG